MRTPTHSSRLAALAVAGAITLTLGTVTAGPTGAASPSTSSAATVAAMDQVEETVTVSGQVAGPDGNLVDNVAVSAYPLENDDVDAADNTGGGTEPAASALTYGGSYDLELATGTYRLVFTDLADRYAPAEVVVAVDAASGDLTLDLVTLAWPSATNTAAPSFTGVAWPGRWLQADPGSWDFPGNVTEDQVTYTYQWLRDGEVVGAGPRYKVTGRDMRRTVAVQVTATIDDDATTGPTQPGVAVSEGVRVAKAEADVRTWARTLGKSNKVRVVVKVATPNKAASGAVTLSVDGKKVAVKEVSGKQKKVTFTHPMLAGQHTIRVRYTGDTATAPALSKPTKVKIAKQDRGHKAGKAGKDSKSHKHNQGPKKG